MQQGYLKKTSAHYLKTAFSALRGASGLMSLMWQFVDGDLWRNKRLDNLEFVRPLKATCLLNPTKKECASTIKDHQVKSVLTSESSNGMLYLQKDKPRQPTSNNQHQEFERENNKILFHQILSYLLSLIAFANSLRPANEIPHQAAAKPLQPEQSGNSIDFGETFQNVNIAGIKIGISNEIDLPLPWIFETSGKKTR